MNVIVPYTNPSHLWKPLQELVFKLAIKEGYPIARVFMKDDDNYWKLLCDIWERREDITIIEHDILVWPGAVKELDDCPADWCSYTYQMKGGYGIHHAFGCTKLTGRFMDKLPDVWVQIDNTHWSGLDAQLCTMAMKQGITPHPHRPPVIHLKGLM